MSTRSGKRIHTSFLEDTATTEQERVVKTERKTRSKRVKEELDELSVTIFKNKKRHNYVSYPIDDELRGDAATKKDGETKPSRALRNALKEHNPVDDSDQLEPQAEEKTLTRKSRRFKKIDDDEGTENYENVPAEVTEVPKSKKNKKKKKKMEAIVDNPSTEDAPPIEEAPPLEEVPAKKSKKKKKKGKKTSSIIVEDVPQNENSEKVLLNRSNVSIDSFHSAAGSPYKNENKETEQVNKIINTFDKTEEITKPTKIKRKNNKKISNNNTFENNDKLVNVPTDTDDENKNNSAKKRKSISQTKETALDECFVSVARENLKKGLEDILNVSNLSNGQLKGRKSITKDATFDKSNISTTLDSNLNDSKVGKGQLKRRKSNIIEVLQPENISEDVLNNGTFDKGLRRRSSIVKDVTFDKNNASIVKEIVDNNNVMDVSNISSKHKSRRSMVKDNMFDKSNVSIAKEIVDNNDDLDVSNISNKQHKTRRSMVSNNTFDKSNASIAKEIVDNNDDMDVFNISNKQHKTRRSIVRDNTFDKSNASIAKEIVDNNDDMDVSNISNKQHKTRRSIVRDNTFDKSNASIAKEIVDDVDINVSNISNKHHKTRRSMVKDSMFDKCNASIAKEDPPVNIDLNVSNKHSKARKSILKDSTFDKSNASITNGSNIEKVNEAERETLLNTTFEKETEQEKETIKDSTFNKSSNKHLDATYEKDHEPDTSTRKAKKSSVNTTYDKTEKAGDTTFEKDNSTSFDAFKKGANNRKSSIRDNSFDKSNFSIASLSKEDFEKATNIIASSATKRRSLRLTFDKNESISENAVNTTYEKTENEEKRKSNLSKTPDIQTVLNTTFEKENTNEGKENLISSSNSRSSLISSDNSSITDKNDISRISITSDDTSDHVENIVNTTPLLIESSMDESHTLITKPESPKPQTPLKREGTFTKDGPEQSEVETPTKRKSLPTAGCTPYHVSKSSQKKTLLNVTRSLEKGVHATVDPAPRMTRVMFCSPVDNAVTFTGEKRKIIKSNLKGSNKSFVFDEDAAMSRPARKRSYTQNDADDARVKRSRLTEDLQHSVDRLSRPRTSSATAKLSVVTPKKPSTPSKPKSEAKAPRTKLPNFAALHQKQFDKMESLNECQERKAKRAKQLLTPTAPPGLLERISPKNNTESPKKIKELAKPKEKTDSPTKKLPAIESSRPGLKEKTDTPTKRSLAIESSRPVPKEKTDTPTKKLPTVESSRTGFTRFGFKLNLDVNPFSIPSKTVEKPKEKPVEKPNGIVPKGLLPSLAGATSLRREVAKLTVMREKSFTDRRNVKRNENRTVIKGVRTNRRFELQMKMRNIE